MSDRHPTTQRGRIRIVGFDDAVADRRDATGEDQRDGAEEHQQDGAEEHQRDRTGDAVGDDGIPA
ncbi:ABC transporter permease, partial [Natrinema soli]